MSLIKIAFVRVYVIIAFFLVIAANSPCLYSQENSTTNADDFLVQASPAWDNLINEYSKGFVATIEYVDSENKRPQTAVLKFKDGMQVGLIYKKEAQDFSDDQKADVVYAENLKYSFHLNKEEDQWRLTDLSRRPDSSQMEYLRFFDDMFAGVLFGDKNLTDLINKPNFEILSLNDVVIDEGNYKELNYRFEEPRDGGIESMTGSIVLDPSLMWTVKRIRFQGDNTEKDSLICQIDCSYQLIEGIPFIQKYEKSFSLNEKSTNPDKAAILQYESVQVKSLQKGGSIPKKCFYLKHYGISEPSFSNGLGSFTKYFLLLVGIILICTGGYLHRRAKKEKTQDEKKS